MNRSPLHKTNLTGLATAAILAAVIAFAGCDSLDIPDPNAASEDAVALQSIFTGMEGSMRTDLQVYLQVTATFGREAYYFEPADPRYTGELFVGPLDPGGFLLNRPWDGRYRVINAAETLMERGAQELSASDQAGVNGVAKTFIGYQLLLNLNYLWDNGIKIVFSDDINTPFVSRAAALAEIASYLDGGHADLTSSGASIPFTFSPGFSGFDSPATFAQFNRAVRARVAVYQEDYPAALDALALSFINPAGNMNAGAYHTYGTGLGDRLNPIFEVPTAPAVKLRAHPDFKAQAEAGDQRFAAKVLDRTGDAGFDPSPGAANGLSSALPVTVSSGSTDPFPIIRNEELILLRAEAYAGLLDFPNAEADINSVRAAAGLDPIAIDAANVEDQLLHERFYSLFLEGHRWIDYRRLGRLTELPTDAVGDPLTAGRIWTQWPRPQNEVPEGS